MTHYSLRSADGDSYPLKHARNINEALAAFGHEHGVTLTLEGDGAAAPAYLLAEFKTGPCWLSYTIPVFVAPL